tara:strand:+ start:309 stop:539 length:231 start_codon:yes stop_codon:yes gene_type:complete
MNVYAHRTPAVPDEIVKNISSRLVSIINGSDVNEIQGGRLLELCRECWGAGWQNGHFIMTQSGIQEEEVSNYGGSK